MDRPQTLNPFLRIGHVFADCLEEPLFQDLLIHMGCGAFCFILEFPVALPDYSAVLAVGVPDLGAVHTATVPAEDLSGEGTADIFQESSIWMHSKLTPVFSRAVCIALVRVSLSQGMPSAEQLDGATFFRMPPLMEILLAVATHFLENLGA